MNKHESLKDFYRRHNREDIPDIGQFNVYRRDAFTCTTYLPSNRRDFYKISLIVRGSGDLHFADKSIKIQDNTLTFSNPYIPYSWEPTSDEQTGYFCVFTDEFLSKNPRNETLSQSPLFKIGGNPVFFPNERVMHFLDDIFTKMLTEIASDYIYKYDLLRNYVELIIHEALKLQPADTFFTHSNAASRISSLFIELLERQFPIDSTEHTLRLKTASDFAESLSLHVNHLNRTVKTVTGKTTTEHIAARITKEAKALLQHTNWNIAEIAYCLGFEHPANFNIFFKKQTGQPPKSFRPAIV